MPLYKMLKFLTACIEIQRYKVQSKSDDSGEGKHLTVGTGAKNEFESH